MKQARSTFDSIQIIICLKFQFEKVLGVAIVLEV